MPIIELFGQPRLLAGVRTESVPGGTARQALMALAARHPQLAGAVLAVDGRLTPAYVLNLNGTRFLADLDEPVQDSDELLLISSLSGG